MSGLPYSPIQLAPASRWLNRFMSSRGEPQTIAPKRSGRRVSMLPISRPPLLRPVVPRCGGRSDLPLDQVLADGDEVLIRLVSVGLERRAVPLRAELAAAADVGDDVDASLLEPGRADGGSVGGTHGDLESAVAVEQGRILAVEGEILAGHLEIGDAGAVLRDGLVLRDGQALGVEERGELLEPTRRGRRRPCRAPGCPGSGSRRSAGNNRRIPRGQPRWRSRRRTRPGPAAARGPSVRPRCVRTSMRLRTLSSSLSRM